MIASQYIPLARRTLKELPTFRQHMIHMALGVTGEFGELIDAAKKVLVYGRPYDHTNAIEEVGDTLWYIAGMVPELMVSPDNMQRALEKGYMHGLKVQQQMDVWSDFAFGEMILSLNKVVSEGCADLPKLSPDAVGTFAAVQYVEVLAGQVGVICGLLGIDTSMAMQRNIEKLAKRYGDKYSDVAALNRDLGGERAVLEGGA